MAEEANLLQAAPKRHDLQTSADLERVTDYAEEKEISADIESVSLLNVWLFVNVEMSFTCAGMNRH